MLDIDELLGQPSRPRITQRGECFGGNTCFPKRRCRSIRHFCRLTTRLTTGICSKSFVASVPRLGIPSVVRAIDWLGLIKDLVDGYLRRPGQTQVL